MLAEFPSGLTFVIAGTTVNEVGLPDLIRGRHATIHLSSSASQANLQPEKIFVEELDAEEFRDPAAHGRVANLHTNFFDCFRSGGTPYCNVDVVVRANTVLALAEMSERLGVAFVFTKKKARTIHTGEGKVIPAMSYDTVVPKLS